MYSWQAFLEVKDKEEDKQRSEKIVVEEDEEKLPGGRVASLLSTEPGTARKTCGWNVAGIKPRQAGLEISEMTPGL